MSGEAAGAEAFLAARPRLRALAYRFLGSMADAEDVVQAAWLRWAEADREAVGDAEAYLHRIVARLCLDELKSARRRRETSGALRTMWTSSLIIAAPRVELRGARSTPSPPAR